MAQRPETVKSVKAVMCDGTQSVKHASRRSVNCRNRIMAALDCHATDGSPKSANANGTTRVADRCFRVECDPLFGFSHRLPGASHIPGTLRSTSGERTRVPRCTQIRLGNAAKAYFDRNFGLHDSVIIAANLTLSEKRGNAGRGIRLCRRNVAHGGPYSLLHRYCQETTAEIAATHNWATFPCASTAAPVCYFFQLLYEARMLIVVETSREALMRGSPTWRGLNSFPS